MGKTTHGKTHNRIYNIYRGMKNRCYNKNDYHYKWYGEKGIKICDKWLNNFMDFYNWSLENGYKNDLSIDRIDSNKDYCPENCKWSTQKQQNNNRNRCVKITINNETHTIAEWSEISGVHRKAISRKLKKGITGEKLIEKVRTPVKCKIIKKDLDGNIIKIWNSLQEISEILNYQKTAISNVCKNKSHYKTSYGYKWEYKKD